MLSGYAGKILRVDLSAGTAKDEALPGKEVLRQYLGSLGLGVKFLSDEVPPEVGPLDPRNRLIFMTGPLTGTPIPCSTSCGVISVNADTGYTAGAAFTHGVFGSYLKFAGYDGIVVQGASDKPVLLWINDGRCQIQDAREVWGKDSHETEDRVKTLVGERRASVAGIGPAGENLLRGACICNDKYHLAAFGGLGAVMGSKRLKAIAVYGRGGVPIANPRELMSISRQWWDNLKAHGTKQELWQGGITRTWTLYGDFSTLAGKNLSTAEFGKEVAAKFVEACKSYQVVVKPCLGCPIACSHKLVITSGPHQGYVATPAGGAESMEGAAVSAGVSEPDSIIWLTDYYDRMGLNSCSLGCAIALAFECYEKGLLTSDKTDGMELRWGDEAAVTRLVDKAIAREGFGKVLAEGPKATAAYIGGEADSYAVYIKGVGPRLHDHRGRFPNMLTSAVASAARLGGPPGIPPNYSLEGIVQRVRTSIMKRNLDDSLGICLFAGMPGVPGFPDVLGMSARALEAITGWPGWTGEELLTIGERIENLMRLFNIQRGLTAGSDLDISARWLEAPADGLCQGKTIGPHIKGLISEYYRLMGWDETTGRPLEKTLERLGLR